MTEERTHLQICQYLRMGFPKVLFNTDLSGMNLSKAQAGKAKMMRSSRAYPDIMIYEPRKGFAALFIELKRPGVRIYRKDGAMVADSHIREQAAMIKALGSRGYCARFAVGFDEAKKLIDWYLKD